MRFTLIKQGYYCKGLWVMTYELPVVIWFYNNLQILFNYWTIYYLKDIKCQCSKNTDDANKRNVYNSLFCIIIVYYITRSTRCAAIRCASYYSSSPIILLGKQNHSQSETRIQPTLYHIHIYHTNKCCRKILPRRINYTRKIFQKHLSTKVW